MITLKLDKQFLKVFRMVGKMNTDINSCTLSSFALENSTDMAATGLLKNYL